MIKKGDLLCDGVKYGNNVVFFEDLSLKTYSRRAQYQNQDFVKWQNMASLIVINNVTAHFFVCRGEIWRGHEISPVESLYPIHVLFISEERVVVSEMRSCEWCFPESTTNFESVPLQYKGFCGFTLVKKNGLLLPGTNSESTCFTHLQNRIH